MSLLALDLNDAAITVTGEGGVLYREPGFVLLDNQRLVAGDAAYRRARLQPRHIHDRFWTELDVEALPDTRFRHLTAADLASRQLEQAWSAAAAAGEAGAAVVAAVPGYMETPQLGLFLGICRELGIPVAGLVDAAIAATRHEYVGAVPVHVDVSLHSTLLTRVGQPTRAQVEKSAVVADSGLVALYDAWIRVISAAFVRQSRFDPLHTAETEQRLYDLLPGWLDAAATDGSVQAVLEHRGLTHTADIDVLTLIAAAAPVYHRIVGQLRALCRAGDVPALQLTDRAARLPGLADMLKARAGGEVFLLEPGATGRGLLARCRHLSPGGEHVTLVRQLPWDQAPVTFALAREEASATGRPSHVLFRNHAWALNGQPLNVGTQPVPGERWIEVDATMPGVSRRHCSIELSSGQCVLRDHSRFGTFLNGHRLDGSATLQAGDEVRVGTPGFELRLITAEQDHAP
ncbi:MAG TPA: FHA domain-containing protein [Woeseiaceae bacterium]|nr:FHA domain-containing protein [Woeseiaceae bacterium]